MDVEWREATAAVPGARELVNGSKPSRAFWVTYGRMETVSLEALASSASFASWASLAEDHVGRNQYSFLPLAR